MLAGHPTLACGSGTGSSWAADPAHVPTICLPFLRGLSPCRLTCCHLPCGPRSAVVQAQPAAASPQQPLDLPRLPDPRRLNPRSAAFASWAGNRCCTTSSVTAPTSSALLVSRMCLVARQEDCVGDAFRRIFTFPYPILFSCAAPL